MVVRTPRPRQPLFWAHAQEKCASPLGGNTHRKCALCRCRRKSIQNQHAESKNRKLRSISFSIRFGCRSWCLAVFWDCLQWRMTPSIINLQWVYEWRDSALPSEGLVEHTYSFVLRMCWNRTSALNLCMRHTQKRKFKYTSGFKAQGVPFQLLCLSFSIFDSPNYVYYLKWFRMTYNLLNCQCYWSTSAARGKHWALIHRESMKMWRNPSFEKGRNTRKERIKQWYSKKKKIL